MRRVILIALLVVLGVGLPSVAQEAEATGEYRLLYTVLNGHTAWGSILHDLVAMDMKGNQEVIGEHLLYSPSLSPDRTKIAARSYDGSLIIFDQRGEILNRHIFSDPVADLVYYRWFSGLVCCSEQARRQSADSFQEEDQRWLMFGWRDDNKVIFSEVTLENVSFYDIDISSSPPSLNESADLNRFFQFATDTIFLVSPSIGCYCGTFLFSPDFHYVTMPLYAIDRTKPQTLESAIIWDIEAYRRAALIDVLPWWNGAPYPAWSPAGDRIAFNQWGKNSHGVYVYDLESPPELIAETNCAEGCFAQNLTWSPRGTYLSYWLYDFTNDSRTLVILDLDTQDTVVFSTEPYIPSLIWTPDERYLTYIQRISNKPNDVFRIQVLEVATGNLVFAHDVPLGAELVGWIAS
jgi:hypothetical protein